MGVICPHPLIGGDSSPYVPVSSGGPADISKSGPSKSDRWPFFPARTLSYKTGLGWKKPWPYRYRFCAQVSSAFSSLKWSFFVMILGLKHKEIMQIFHCVFRGNNQSNSFRALVVLVRALGRTRVSFQMSEWVGVALARLKSFRLFAIHIGSTRMSGT